MSKDNAVRVVVAMSGGVDSSLAAALLVEQGYEVIGVMMRLWAELVSGEARSNKCCSLEAVDDARRVADQLGIPFYLINVEQVFKQQVVDFTIDRYLAGQTPNPCIQCNRYIRFGYLFDYAMSLGADYLATGHYARVKRPAAGRDPRSLKAAEDGTPSPRLSLPASMPLAPSPFYQLLMAVDRQKDQSYVLHVLTQRELSRVLFPVGDYTKMQVREMAAARGLPVASRHDSQDLCFLADGDYRRFLRDWAPDGSIRPGPIVDSSGRQLGQHRGLPFYTIGQRKGLGIGGAPEPLYVLDTDPAGNTVVVGLERELGRRELTACTVNWIAGHPPQGPVQAQVKIRYRARLAPALVTPLNDDCASVRFEESLRDITPGQGAVFYQGELCLGGGIIV